MEDAAVDENARRQAQRPAGGRWACPLTPVQLRAPAAPYVLFGYRPPSSMLRGSALYSQALFRTQVRDTW